MVAPGPAALIGHSGFVGSTLKRQRPFSQLYRSTNIADILGQRADLAICAGAPAQMWVANAQPDADRRQLDGLMAHLEGFTCTTFVLISTVAVFAHPVGVDEETAVDETGLTPYGRHRLALEHFVRQRFARHLVVRLPGLVGPGLRKNVVYDFAHHNRWEAIDGRGVYQFYPMANLWPDIAAALTAGLSLVHLTAAPLTVADVARFGFGLDFAQEGGGRPAAYDMRSRHAQRLGGQGAYTYSRRESLQAIRAYAQGVAAAEAGEA